MMIANVSIRRPVMTLTLTAATLIFGWMAFTRMGWDLFPEIELPMVTVTTTLVGASPEVMDQDVTDVLEEQIKAISGIRTLTSQSFEGFSRVVIEFELEKNVDVAANEVRAKVNLARRNLPRDIDEPLVDKLDIGAQPILWIAVSGSADYRTLAHVADKVVKEQLQSVSGVGNIALGGLRDREVRVWLDPTRLEARGLTAQDVVRAIGVQHVELPGGRIETPRLELSVKVQGEYDSVAALAQLVVAERGGVVTRLADVGRVDDGSEDQRSLARFNGRPGIGLGIRKQSGTNTVAVANAVKQRLAEIAAELPAGVHADIVSDSSDFILSSMRGVQEDIVLGVLLTALIMWLFLKNLRITFVSVIAIPVSLIGGFVAMNALGFTINNMTMLAMSLAVGMVIDDAIVVLENVFRHVEEGRPAMAAASEGTAEVGLAVLAATSSVAAVFFPVAFMHGIIGRFFYQFGLTVALTIILSALVSLTLTPFLCSRMLHHEASHNRLYVLLEQMLVGLTERYRRALGWALGHRKAVILIALAAFAGGLALLPFIGSEFMTQADESRFIVRLELPTGTSLTETERRLRGFEQVVLSQPETKSVYSTVGVNSSEVNRIEMLVNLVPRHERRATQRDVMARLRERYRQEQNATVAVEAVSIIGGGFRSADVQIAIQGTDVQSLARVSDEVVSALGGEPGFTDVDTDLRLSKPDVKVHINRALADRLGVNVRAISSEIYALFGGLEAATFKEGGYRYAVRVRALPEFRGTPADLERVPVRAVDGSLVKAPNLMSYEPSRGPNAVNRLNRRRAVTIFANVSGIPEGQALTRALEVARQHLPTQGGWTVQPLGRSRIARESFQDMLLALVLSILIIYMILAIQFESFLHPLVMMLALPLTLIGVFGGLLVTGSTLSIFSMIGIIMLMGIVTKNGILLVDFANQARERGADPLAAMLEAGPIRLRPILMTATAVVIGVLPVALALSEGGETRAPMAIAVIGGTITSTVLTLIVVPVVYVGLEGLLPRVRERLARRRAARTIQPSTAE